jgi:hypothetical protein
MAVSGTMRRPIGRFDAKFGIERDREFESGSLQQRVCKLSVPHESSCGPKESEASRISTRGWDREFESPLLQR